MFRLSNNDDVPELRTLWKKCFDADRAFLDLFFGKGYGLTRTYVTETEAGIVSALSVFPVKYAGHSGGYVYGVCTHPEHRGHRHAVELLRHVEEQLLDKELDFIILRPASPTLFDYYRKQGYGTTLYRSIENMKLPLIPAEIMLEPLSEQTMYEARAGQCHQGRLFEWSEEMCGYLLAYIEYCNGKAYKINYGEGYVICYPDSRDSAAIICEEYAGSISEALSLIPYWIKNIYPNANTVTIADASNRKKEHMLCKTRLDLFSETQPLFTFTME